MFGRDGFLLLLRMLFILECGQACFDALDLEVELHVEVLM